MPEVFERPLHATDTPDMAYCVITVQHTYQSHDIKHQTVCANGGGSVSLQEMCLQLWPMNNEAPKLKLIGNVYSMGNVGSEQ